MARLESTPQPEHNPMQRWEKILAMPEETELHDISTGARYRRGMFKPIHRNEFENKVDYFQIIGTAEQVYVPFLRLVSDHKYCSLVEG